MKLEDVSFFKPNPSSKLEEEFNLDNNFSSCDSRFTKNSLSTTNQFSSITNQQIDEFLNCDNPFSKRSVLKFDDLSLEEKSSLSTEGDFDLSLKAGNDNEYGTMMLKLEKRSLYQGEKLRGKVLFRLHKWTT